jgi:hypothetical protein
LICTLPRTFPSQSGILKIITDNEIWAVYNLHNKKTKTALPPAVEKILTATSTKVAKVKNRKTKPPFPFVYFVSFVVEMYLPGGNGRAQKT